MEYVNCALCGSSTSSPWVASGEHTVVRCDTCGLLFVNPRSAVEDADTLYDGDYYHEMYLAGDKVKREYFARSLRDLAPHVAGTGSLLDVGTGTGLFVAVAKELGWDAVGVEPSRWAVEFGNQTYGLELLCGSVLDLAPRMPHYDVITMWEALEHTRAPLQTLQAINALLKPQGVLALSVPNAAGLAYRCRWIDEIRPRYHTYHFTPQTIRALLKKAGFTVLKLRTASVYAVAGCLRAGARTEALTVGRPGALARAAAKVGAKLLALRGAERLANALLDLLNANDRMFVYALREGR